MNDDQRFDRGPQRPEGPQIPEIKLPSLDGGKIRLIVGAVVILMLAFTSFYTIEPEETGLVLRFGKYVETTTAGLSGRVPRPLLLNLA